MSTQATPPAISDAKIFASEEINRRKGFLGTTDEMTSVAETRAPHSVAWVKSLSDDELFPLGERALQDIADDILVLDEIRQRFRLKGSMRGYSGWKEFVEKNSRYSMRTIQNRLAEKNGKEESKANHNPGNMYTRPAGRPSTPIHIPKGLEEANLDVFRRVQEGSLQVRTPKPKSRANYSERDYFARVGRGLAAAFSGVDERLTELASIKKSEWTPEAEEGVRCLLLNLKEVSEKADDYAAKLKAVLRKNAKRDDSGNSATSQT